MREKDMLAIVRVGDKVSAFDGPAAQHRAGREVSVQRRLLDGGTWEATAYQLCSYTCGAASIALGNYHNCTPAGTIRIGVRRD
jgi:hypothetical protein